jgi:hypothetical protein
LAGNEAEQEIVLVPAEPAWFDVAAEMPAIANEFPTDVPAIVDIKWDEHSSEIDMSPGLRPIGGDG